MLILAILVIGMTSGWIAQLILHPSSSTPGGALAAGLLGSFVGGLIGSVIAGEGIAIKPSGIVGSVIGAILVLSVWGRILARR
jgi:uncharacterized membrane protein YeaQ/YmgE (transglycosylase-associated protein family)